MTTLKKLIPDSLKPMLKRIKHFIHRIITGDTLISTKCDYFSISEEKRHIFFGYYDITPFSNDDKRIIFIKSNKSKADICLMNMQTKEITNIADTNVWNWQQGCRLRWINNDNAISYNNFINGNYCNVWHNISTGEKRIYNLPFYDISKDEKFAASLDFERLGLLRPGYGYRELNIPKNELSEEGFSIIDLFTGNVIKKFSLSELRDSVSSNTSIDNCYVNHLSFCPFGPKILFFFIEIIGSYHKASLMVYDYQNDIIIPIDTDNKASHYVWKDSDTIVCTSMSKDKQWGYYLYSIKDLHKKQFGEGVLLSDGHPSIYESYGIITDTYPDFNGYQRIYRISDISKVKLDLLIKIYSQPVQAVEKRTDLHPRLNHGQDQVCFDANVYGYRTLNILTIDSKNI